MEVPSHPYPEQQLAHAGRLIVDLDELLQVMLRPLRATKPWQRQLVTLLRQAEQQVQVLRMTIALERHAVEIRDASNELRNLTRQMSSAMAGSRADRTTLQAIQLLIHMADAISHALQALSAEISKKAASST